MPSLESVLGAAGNVELSGAVNPIFGALTMAHDPATGRRAFRLVLDPDAEECGSAITRIDDVEIDQVEVIGYPNPDCSGPHVCASPMITLALPFGPVPGAPGQTRECQPVVHDDARITGLMLTCSCATPGVRSVQIRVTIRVFDRGKPPMADQWVRGDFRFCDDCTERRS
jgi:hypothetical protein